MNMKYLAIVISWAMVMTVSVESFAARAAGRGGNTHRAPSAPSNVGGQSQAPQSVGGKCQWECAVVTVTQMGKNPSPIGSSWKLIQGCDDGQSCDRPDKNGISAMECRPLTEQIATTACR